MKIEKINDNQIRCTLTKDDLADRQLKLSELTYGTEKAKNLFRDMMMQASVDFGFEADNIPLMIEAIPLPNECIVLIITKVEDPEELDTRFSKFAPATSEESDIAIEPLTAEGADNILDIFKRLLDRHTENLKDTEKDSRAIELSEVLDLTAFYVFKDFDTLLKAAHVLKEFYQGDNSLYKCKDGTFFLSISKSNHTPEEFNKVTNILSEYAKTEPYKTGRQSYLKEHEKLLIATDALQRLAAL